MKTFANIKDSETWDAGIRGVLYRELKDGKRFKKIGISIYALADYKEELKPDPAYAVYRPYYFIFLLKKSTSLSHGMKLPFPPS